MCPKTLKNAKLCFSFIVLTVISRDIVSSDKLYHNQLKFSKLIELTVCWLFVLNIYVVLSPIILSVIIIFYVWIVKIYSHYHVIKNGLFCTSTIYFVTSVYSLGWYDQILLVQFRSLCTNFNTKLTVNYILNKNRSFSTVQSCKDFETLYFTIALN